MTDILIKRGNLDTDMYKVRTWGECHLQAKECLRPPEARREAWNRFSLTALRRSQPCWRLDVGLPASGTEREYISVV